MHIEIKIPVGNPWQVACLVAIGAWAITALHQAGPVEAHVARDSEGGDKNPQAIIASNESVERERIKQAVLAKREEILRYDLLLLTDEAARIKTPEALANLEAHRAQLVELIKEKKESENLLKESLITLWEAQGTEYATAPSTSGLKLSWPVEPQYGVSAKFDDDDYKQRFGVPHHAIDIPIEQGSVIRAPADGVVIAAKDNGLGYSYVTIRHEGGIETIYGHVSGFILAEGDEVREGQPIALSGGRPGSKGAGLLTTGPHLHFAVRENGVLVDPLQFLMPWKGITEDESVESAEEIMDASRSH